MTICIIPSLRSLGKSKQILVADWGEFILLEAWLVEFLGISMVIFIHSLLRVDPTPLWLNLSMGTWISMINVLAALSGLSIPHLRERAKNDDEKVEIQP